MRLAFGVWGLGSRCLTRGRGGGFGGVKGFRSLKGFTRVRMFGGGGG